MWHFDRLVLEGCFGLKYWSENDSVCVGEEREKEKEKEKAGKNWLMRGSDGH